MDPLQWMGAVRMRVEKALLWIDDLYFILKQQLEVKKSHNAGFVSNIHSLPKTLTDGLNTQASVWIQPLNDLRWPNTWEEMMTTPRRTSEEANHHILPEVNYIEFLQYKSILEN